MQPHLRAAEPVRRQAHPAGRRRAPERDDAVRPRPEDVGARRQLQGARARQPLRRRRQLLPVERRGEPGADDHGQRAARRRSPARAARRHARAHRSRHWHENAAPRSRSRFALILLSRSRRRSPRPSGGTARASTAVDSIGMTVADMDRAVDFYTRVLTFEKVSDVEVSGREVELPPGVFGARMRVVRLRLGDESIELTEYLAPQGRPVPADMRPNDRAFQHVAIIVSDMDAAYARLQAVPRRARVDRPAAPARLESERRRDQRLLLPRSGSAFPRDPAVSRRARGSAKWQRDRSPVPRHRPHGDRRRRHRRSRWRSTATAFR